MYFKQFLQGHYLFYYTNLYVFCVRTYILPSNERLSNCIFLYQYDKTYDMSIIIKYQNVEFKKVVQI